MKSNFLRLLSTFTVTKHDILEAFITALLFSSFLYLAYFEIHFILLNTLLALLAFYRLINSRHASFFLSGFFIGLLWFYWVGFSFRYYDLSLFSPLVALFFATGYLLIFWVLGFTSQPWQRAIALLVLTFLEPFAFNWLKPELLLVESYFGVQLWQYALILLAIALFQSTKKPFRYLSIVLLLGAIDFDTKPNNTFPLPVSIVQSNILQNEKWKPHLRTKHLQTNINYVKEAIKKGDALVILPESNIPLFLNRYPHVLNTFKKLSMHIDIIVGALMVKDDNSYNATYHFSQGKLDIATKMILVPFGEYLPLPNFITNWLKENIFNGADDYKTALEPTNFMIHGIKVRNAICYEATCEIMYNDAPKFIIASSNNAWFTPSIEPILQQLLIKLYAKRYHKTVLHSINGSKSGIIYPKGNL